MIVELERFHNSLRPQLVVGMIGNEVDRLLCGPVSVLLRQPNQLFTGSTHESFSMHEHAS